MRQWMTAAMLIAALHVGAAADGCLSADDPFQTGCGPSMYDDDEYDAYEESEDDNESDPQIRDD